MRRAAALAVAVALASGCSGGSHATSVATRPTATAPTPAATAPAVDPARLLVQRAVALRGLALRRPLVIRRLARPELGALLRRLSASDPDPTASAGTDDALHLLGVLRPGQRLAAVLQAELQGQVAGLYDPLSRRLYLVRDGGGGVPPSVIVHEATHALQDQHFDLRHGRFAAHPHDDDGDLAARALVEGDALEVQSRYLRSAGLAAALLEGVSALGELAGQPADSTPHYLARELLFPYLAGQRLVLALRAHGGQARLDAAFRHPPRTTAAVLDPARYLAGDPAPQRVPLPAPRAGERRELRTTFGAEDVAALTGDDALARGWLGGGLAVDRHGRRRRLLLRVATSQAPAVARALLGVLPAASTVRVQGRLVVATGVATVAPRRP